MDEQIINVIVRQKNTPPWFLSAIYALPNHGFWLHLWEYLICMARLVMVPWMLIGDFNQILCADENRGGRPTAAANMTLFVDMIQQCSLHDLGFDGPRYTWSNMRQDADLVQERLDRVLCN